MKSQARMRARRNDLDRNYEQENDDLNHMALKDVSQMDHNTDDDEESRKAKNCIQFRTRLSRFRHDEQAARLQTTSSLSAVTSSVTTRSVRSRARSANATRSIVTSPSSIASQKHPRDDDDDDDDDAEHDSNLDSSVSPSKSPQITPSKAKKKKKKKKRSSSKYAPPSTYSHLPPLPDSLSPGLITIFIGTNPGLLTAQTGWAYAHPSNLFWKLLYSSGCVPCLLPPSAAPSLPSLYQLGNTNLVSRPTRDAGELSKTEMAAGTPDLEAKIAKHRPESVCVVGKGIWQAIWRWRYGREMRKDEFRYGWQDEKENMGKAEGWDGARVYVTSTTSGLAAGLRPAEKEAIWRPFGEWVHARRQDRLVSPSPLPAVKKVEGSEHNDCQI